MTKEEFRQLTQSIVLLDGATGSNLMAAGMPKGICTRHVPFPGTKKYKVNLYDRLWRC